MSLEPTASEEVLDQDLSALSLDELATYAREQAHLFEEWGWRVAAAMEGALGHALQLGAALNEAKHRLSSKDWEQWVTENIGVTRSATYKYLRLHHHRDEVANWLSDGGSGNVKDAEAHLLGLPPIAGGPMSEELKADARRLHADGMNPNAIGRLLGVSSVSVRDWVIPGHYEAKLKRARERGRRRSEARRALAEKERRAERDRLAKAAGGSTADAYALIRRTAIALDKAIADDLSPGARDAMRDALAHAHRAEDSIVEALRIGRQA